VSETIRLTPGILEAQSPADVVPLKLLLELEAMAVYKLGQSLADEFGLISEPAIPHEPFYCLGEPFRNL